MNPVVVEVGPQTIRGPNPVPPESVSVAVECIDDDLALLGERLIEVRRLWSDLLEAAAGGCDEPLVLVVPTWWSAVRVDLVGAAARDAAADVVVLRRGMILSADSGATVVEFSGEFLVIVSAAGQIDVVPRGERDVAALLAEAFLTAATEIVIDVPAAVPPPPPALGARLRALGIAVAYGDRRRMLRAAGAALP
ncbi:MAG: type VII secretion-associated protein, partial [Mycobacterium sp.]|nr:type VII secretion-associated protein [Mycobacterium sp.]